MLTTIEESYLKTLADSHEALVELQVAFTDNYVGEFGEFFACRLLNLSRLTRSSKGADAIDQNGKKYQVKATVITTNSFSYKIKNLKPDFFDILIIVHLNDSFKPIGFYEVQSSAELSSFSVTPRTLTLANNHNVNKLSLSELEEKAIKNFTSSFNQVRSLPFIRTAKIVGEIGEYLAAKRLNLQLAISNNQKGYDASDSKGNFYEIKTRRVYSSIRRKSETRRLNNLVGKTCNYLIIVVLDYNFRCAGMWLMEPKNVINVKSANLKIVNTTPGVMNLIPSKIDYLSTGNIYIEHNMCFPTKTPTTKRAGRPKKSIVKADPIENAKSPLKLRYFFIASLVLLLFMTLYDFEKNDLLGVWGLITFLGYFIYKDWHKR